MCAPALPYRAATWSIRLLTCLHCPFEGPERTSENEAAEDHCWHHLPVYLSVAPKAPERGSRTSWLATVGVQKVNELCTARMPVRSVSGAAAWAPGKPPNARQLTAGDYDLCGEIACALMHRDLK